MIAWSKEPVQLVYKSNTRASVKPVLANAEGNYPERDVALGCDVLPYEGEVTRRVCMCGCGKTILEGRSDRKYATSACRIRVSKRKSRGNT